MATRHTPFRTALAGALLLIPAGCATNSSVQQADGSVTGERPAAPATAVERSPVTDARRSGPAPCPTGTARSWVLHQPTAVSLGVSDIPWMTPSVVVSSIGTATVAYTADEGMTRTADDPPTARDPQDPSHGEDEPFLSPGEHLALDGADVQTLAYDHTVRITTNGFFSVSDLVLTDRPSGGTWSTSRTRVEKRMIERSDLAVNASGAAVVVWAEFITPGGDERLRAVFRSAAGAAWTAPQRVPAPHAFDFDAEVDDRGRVLLTYDSMRNRREGVYAVRRDAAGDWTSPRLISRDTELFGVALSPGGAAVVTHGRVDGDGAPRGPHYASFMTADGSWSTSRRQPADIGTSSRTIGIDARGRALIAGWDGNDL